MRLISLVQAAFFCIIIASPTVARAPNVLTDTRVTHSLVTLVMGDTGAPSLLLDALSDPHHAQLRPSQARALAQADVFFWIGAPLTPWLENKVETLLPQGAAFALLGFKGTELRAFEEDHDDDALDPHAWLDPTNARVWLAEIATILSKFDPENADTYRANAIRAQSEIDALSAQIAADLTFQKPRNYIASHDAFDYLSARFNLHIVASISDGHANAPGAASLSALRRTIENQTIDCIFSETPGPDLQAARIAADTGIPLALLDPTGAMQDAGPALYGAMMRKLANDIARCGAPK